MLCPELGTARFWLAVPSGVHGALGKAAPNVRLLRGLVLTVMLWEPRIGALALPQLEGKEGPEGGLDGIGQVKCGASQALKSTVCMWVLQAA